MAKLVYLKMGDRFRLAGYPEGTIYIKRGVVPRSCGSKYYVENPNIGFVYHMNATDEVERVGNIND